LILRRSFLAGAITTLVVLAPLVVAPQGVGARPHRHDGSLSSARAKHPRASGYYSWDIQERSSSDDCTYGCETENHHIEFTTHLSLRLARAPGFPTSGLSQWEDDGSSSYQGSYRGHLHIDADPTLPDDDPSHGCTGNQDWTVSGTNLRGEETFTPRLEVAFSKARYVDAPEPDVLFGEIAKGSTTETESGCHDATLNHTQTSDYYAEFEPGLFPWVGPTAACYEHWHVARDVVRLRCSFTTQADQAGETTISTITEFGDIAVPPLKCFRIGTGPGYAELTDRMKAALSRLYATLEREHACYVFVLGWRSQAYQNHLREDWHRIADRPKGDPRSAQEICGQLDSAGYGQCPTGWSKPDDSGKRTAKGGPAKVSRHTSGAAADITVTWPLEPDLSKYRPAARQAGLCGPDKTDPSHVELPYKHRDRHHPGKEKYGCAFPEGPPPDG
jgi:hypothetical protein